MAILSSTNYDRNMIGPVLKQVVDALNTGLIGGYTGATGTNFGGATGITGNTGSSPVSLGWQAMAQSR